MVVAEASTIRRVRVLGAPAGQDVFDRRADSRAQLSRGLFGKRNDQDLIDLRCPSKQEIDHDALDREGLAGAGAGVDYLVSAVENLVEDRGTKIFEVVGEGVRIHFLNLPVLRSRESCPAVSLRSQQAQLRLETPAGNPWA